MGVTCLLTTEKTKTFTQSRMDIVIRSSLSQPSVLDVTEKNGILAMICEETSGRALFYAEQSNGTWVQRRLNILDQSFAKRPAGRCVRIGCRDHFVYTTSKDARSVFVLSGPELSGSYTLRKDFKEVFDSPILGLWLLRNNKDQTQHQCFLLAISQSGEILLIDDNSDKLCSRIETTLTSSLDRVMKVSQISDNSVALIGQKDGNHQMHIVRFDSLETLESIELSHSSPVSLFEGSEIPVHISSGKNKEVVDFALKRHCLCVLYQGGYVCFFKSRGVAFHSLARTEIDFASPPHQQDQKAAHLSVYLAQAITLHASLKADDMNDNDLENSGFVANVEDDFFTVGYGKYVSVWDCEYHVLHKYVQVDSRIQRRCSGMSTAGRFFFTDSGVQEVVTPTKKGSKRVSLGMAMKRKDEFSKLVRDIHQTIEKAPLRSQPLSIAPIKAAADANSHSTKMFETHISLEDQREDNLVRDILTKSATPTAEALMALICEETRIAPTHSRRRRNRGHNSMGLTRLPSERLAAVTVARCLYEVQAGDSKFLVPLIDMIGTGVVSNEAVLAVADISDSWCMGSNRKPFHLQSIVDPLLSSMEYSHALEGMISTVGDLPHLDFVRVLRHAVCVLEECSAKKENGLMKANGRSRCHDAHSSETRKRVRCQRLLERCFECSIDQEQSILSVRRLPFSDIVMILRRFQIVLGETAPTAEGEDLQELGKPLKGLQSGMKDVAFTGDAAKCYRGVNNWIDNDRFTKRKRRAIWTRGCITWTCHMIDAHLSTLILDESGRELAEQLLQAVKERRKGLEQLKSLEGLAGHLAHRKAVPSGPDALYNKRTLLVPHGMGLF